MWNFVHDNDILMPPGVDMNYNLAFIMSVSIAEKYVLFLAATGVDLNWWVRFFLFI